MTKIAQYIEQYPDGRFYTVGEWGTTNVPTGHLVVGDQDTGIICVAPAERAAQIADALNAQHMLPAAIEDAAEDRGDWIAVLSTLTPKSAVA